MKKLTIAVLWLGVPYLNFCQMAHPSGDPEGKVEFFKLRHPFNCDILIVTVYNVVLLPEII